MERSLKPIAASMPIRRSLWSVFAALTCAVLVAGCLSRASSPSTVWPPEDFALEVEQLESSAAGIRVVRRFSVDRDGLCIYAESDGVVLLPGGALQLPLFHRMSSFLMREESVRMLSRLLFKRGVLELRVLEGETEAGTGSSIVHLRYRGFGEQRRVVNRGEIYGAAVRVLKVVNSFLPAGRSFELPGLYGEKEPLRLTGIPPVQEDPAGIQDFLERESEGRTSEPRLLLVAMALALDRSDHEAAARILSRYRSFAATAEREAAMFPDVGGEMVLTDRLVPVSVLEQALESTAPVQDSSGES